MLKGFFMKAIDWISNNSSKTFDKVISENSDYRILPLTHKVTCFKAQELLDDKVISPIECDVFNGKKLIYLFYGLPSYAIAQGKGSRNDYSYYPVCFLLNFEKISFGNVFPFDSGAFKEEYYKKYLNDEMKLYDFALQPNIDYINRFVSTFYSSNKDYYHGKTKSSFDSLDYNPVLDYHIDSYIRMISRTEESSIDARAHSVEIISEDSIPLGQSLLAIFAPRDFCDQFEIATKYANIDIIKYNTFNYDPPSSYNSIIKDLVYKYVEEKELL